MHGNLAITLKNCADCHKELGRFKQAYNDYSKSLEIYKVYLIIKFRKCKSINNKLIRSKIKWSKSLKNF